MGDEKNERISKDFRTGNIIQLKDITETIWSSSKMGDTCHICGENFSSDLSFTEHILTEILMQLNVDSAKSILNPEKNWKFT